MCASCLLTRTYASSSALSLNGSIDHSVTHTHGKIKVKGHAKHRGPILRARRARLSYRNRACVPPKLRCIILCSSSLFASAILFSITSCLMIVS